MGATGAVAIPTHADRWVDDARAGRSDGFDKLYQWLGGPVRGFAAARGAADPDGVVNEVFLKAFRNMENFDGDGRAFRSWMFSTARHHLIDEARKRARRPKMTDAEVPEVASDAADVGALASLGNERVASLLAELTGAQREVIVLRIIADLSLSEVAEIVGRPATAVKRLQARGLRALQQKILDETVSE